MKIFMFVAESDNNVEVHVVSMDGINHLLIV